MIHYVRGSLEEYLTADEQDVSIDASPSAVVGEEQHSEGTPNTQGSSDATSPEETSDESPPGVGPAGLPSTSLPQSTSSYAATASWRPEYWEAWHARSKGAVCVCVCACGCVRVCVGVWVCVCIRGWGCH